MSFLCFDHKLNEIFINNEFQYQRSFLYGDGHFSTAKVIDGYIQFLSSHLARLKQANDRLNFSSVDWDKLHKVLEQNAKQLTLGFIKIHFSRGHSLRGYGQCAQINTNVFISFGELSAPFVNTLQHPNTTKLTQLTTQLGLQPLLAGLKHCNRLEQVLASAELEQTDFPDGLIADIQGNIIETTKANIIWHQQGTWYTPSLNNSGVSGVMLNQLLEQRLGLVEIEQNMAFVSQNADAMIICNSLIGLQAVSSIDDRILDVELSQKFMKEVKSV